MTVSTTNTTAILATNGATTAFPFTFYLEDEAHLVITRRVTATGLIDKTYNTAEYSVAISNPGGTVTITPALASGYEIIIKRVVPYTQLVDIVNQGGFYPDVFEGALDLESMGLQQLDERLDRALLVADGETGYTFPTAANREDTVFGFDENGDPTTFAPSVFKGDPGGNVLSVGLASQIGSLIAVADGTDLIHTSGYDVVGRGAAFYVEDSLADAPLLAAHPLAVKQDTGGRIFRLAGRVITPEQMGVSPATETSAGQEMVDAFRYLRDVTGGGVLELTPFETYSVNDLVTQTIETTLSYPDGQVMLPPAITLAGNGATLSATVGGADAIKAMGDLIGSYVVDPVAMAVGDDTFLLDTVADALNFEVGQTVLWRLGDVAYDLPETYNWGIATVEAVNTGTGVVTLSKALSRAWDGTGTNNKHLHIIEPLAGTVLAGTVNLLPATVGSHYQAGLTLTRGKDVRVGNVIGKGCRAGVFIAQYVDGFHVDLVSASDSTETGANQGQGCRFAESRGRIDRLEVVNCWKEGLLAEAACDISIGYHRDDNPSDATTRRVIYANGESRVHVENGFYTGKGGHYILSADNDSRITWGRMRCELSSAPYSLPVPGRGVDVLELRINGTEEMYRSADAIWWEFTVELTDGMNKAVYGPSGVVLEAEVMQGGSAVRGDLSNLFIGRDGDAADMLTSLSIGASTTWKDLAVGSFNSSESWGVVAGNKGWTLRGAKTLAVVATPAGSALKGSGKYLRFRYLIIPNSLAATGDAFDLASAATDRRFPHLEGAKTHDWADLATATQQSTTVTVTGAVVGDLVTGVSMDVALNGTRLWGEVTAADTVTVYHRNDTGGNVNVVSGLLAARVAKRVM